MSVVVAVLIALAMSSCAAIVVGTIIAAGDPTPDHAPSSGYSAVAWSDPFDDDEVIERNDEGVGA